MEGAVGVLAKGYFCSLSRFFFFLWFPQQLRWESKRKTK
jgi:hypothetical protein